MHLHGSARAWGAGAEPDVRPAPDELHAGSHNRAYDIVGMQWDRADTYADIGGRTPDTRTMAGRRRAWVFLFKTMSSLGDFRKVPAPTPHILTELWQRVGYDPLQINKI